MDMRICLYLSLIGGVLCGSITVERKIGYSPDRFVLYGDSCTKTNNCSTYSATSLMSCECMCNNITGTYSLSTSKCVTKYSECTALKFISHDKIYSFLFIKGSQYQIPQQVQDMGVNLSQCRAEILYETLNGWTQSNNISVMLTKTSQLASSITLMSSSADDEELTDLSGYVILIKFNCQQSQYCITTKYQGVLQYEVSTSTPTPSSSVVTATRFDAITVFYIAGIFMFVLVITAVIGLIVYKCFKYRHQQPDMKVERLDENGNGSAHSMSVFRLNSRFTKHRPPSSKITGRFIKNTTPRDNPDPLTRSQDSIHPRLTQSLHHAAASPEPSRPNSARSATFTVNPDKPDQILHRLPFKTGLVNSRPPMPPFDPDNPEPITDEHRLNPNAYKAVRYIKRRLAEFEGTGLPQMPTRDMKEQFFKPQHQKLANYGGIIGEYSEQGGALKESEEILSSRLTINYDQFETECSTSSNQTAVGAVSRHSQQSAAGSNSYQPIEWEPITEDADGAASVVSQADQHPDMKFDPKATPFGTIRPGFFFQSAPVISSSEYATIPFDGQPLEPQNRASGLAVASDPSAGHKSDPIYAVVKKKKKKTENFVQVKPSNNEQVEDDIQEVLAIPPPPRENINSQNHIELSAREAEFYAEIDSASLHDDLTLDITDVHIDSHEKTTLRNVFGLAHEISISSNEDSDYRPELEDGGFRPEAEGAANPDMPSTNIDDLVFPERNEKNEPQLSDDEVILPPSIHL